jgi:tetratricopeptide (TPR) repeat protein
MPHPELETAQTLLDHGDLENAQAAFAQAAARFPREASAYGGRGAVLLALERFEAAVSALRQAAQLEPQSAEWQNLLGVALCQVGDLAAAEVAFRQALKAAPRGVAALLNLIDLYRAQGRYPEAMDSLRLALGLAPENGEVLVNFGLLSQDLEEPQGVQAALEQLRSVSLIRTRVTELLQPFLSPASAVSLSDTIAPTALCQIWAMQIQGLPAKEQRQRLATEVRRQAKPSRVWGADEIAVFCRQHMEKWSPRSLTQGIGGSEEAVIYLSRELAGLGWKVTVYGNPVEEAGEYDGVTYRSYYNFNPADQFNILVGWHGVGFFDSAFMARGTYLWLHGVPRAEGFNVKRLSHITKIFVLSQFHRQQLPALPDEKFMITANGIDVGQIETLESQALPRLPQRCIYASSYDRGLETLLTIWPEVRQAVPQAELHIFYGWETFQAVNQGHPDSQAWKAHMERLMDQPGVHHHGRVGQQEVVAETFRSGIWAYPMQAHEISCITAMKCQAAGAVPVTSSYAALRETVQYGVRLEGVDDRPYSPAKRQEYTQALIGALQDPAWQEQTRREMMPWARQKFSWQNVACQWDEEFRRVIRQGI